MNRPPRAREIELLLRGAIPRIDSTIDTIGPRFHLPRVLGAVAIGATLLLSGAASVVHGWDGRRTSELTRAEYHSLIRHAGSPSLRQTALEGLRRQMLEDLRFLDRTSLSLPELREPIAETLRQIEDTAARRSTR